MAAKSRRRKWTDETSTKIGSVQVDGDAVVGSKTEAGGDIAGGNIIKAEAGATIIIDGTKVVQAHDETPAPGDSPFMGLPHFEERDADRFSGREALAAKLVARLTSSQGERQGESRFLAIIGASGSGKSSLVRAGLIPAIRRDTRWLIHIITPTAHPLESLAASLTRDSESVTAAATLIDDLTKDARSLHLAILRATHLTGASHVLLIVDQFEELFTACKSETERRLFANNLMAATTIDGPAILVIALRADFYEHCAQFDHLREALAKQQEYIGPMSANEMRHAIEEPAKRGGWEFEPGLVELLLRDVGDEPGALPLLSQALLETWNRRRGHVMTLAGYHESGGVHGAIAQTANETFNRLTPTGQEIARRIFLRLTELGESTQDTRRRIARDEIISNLQSQPSAEVVLKTLADARLIMTDKDMIEVAHEALIREWPRLREWLDEDREGLRIHRQLTNAAREWGTLKRDPGALYRGARLTQANEWASNHIREMDAQEHEFLNASRMLRAKERRAWQIIRAAILVNILTITGIVAVATSELRSQAEINATVAAHAEELVNHTLNEANLRATEASSSATREAEANEQLDAANRRSRVARAGQLAAQAQIIIDRYPERSLLLASEALSITLRVGEPRVPAAEDILRQTLREAGYSSLEGHNNRLSALAFSPNGKWLATASDDATTRLWSVDNPHTLPKVLEGGAGFVSALAFSQDERWLATASAESESGNARVWLWQVDNPKSDQGRLLNNESNVTALAFSPNSNWLATGSVDTVTRLWQINSSTAKPIELRKHTSYIRALMFSPNGEWLATGSGDATALLWHVDNPTDAPIELKRHKDDVVALAFSPNGEWLATGSLDDTTLLWRVDNPTDAPIELKEHKDDVVALAFSPNGEWLATASKDSTVQLWAIDNLKAGSIVLNGHEDYIRDLAFSPDGHWLATASKDSTVRLWDIDNPKAEPVVLRGHTDNISDLEFSPDGHWLATASWDKTARLWNMRLDELMLLACGQAGRNLTQTEWTQYFPDESYRKTCEQWPEGK